MVQRRIIVGAIIFSFITFGIYQFYWIYKIAQETRILNDDGSGSAGMDLLLTIVTCGIYGFFVIYQASKRTYEVELKRGGSASDDSVLITILYAFVGIVSMAIIQSKINEIVG